MANIYDQFDAPSAPNPYDQFDVPAPSQQAAPSAPSPEGIYDASTIGTAVGNTIGAALEPMATMASGGAASAIGGVAGLVTLVANKLGMTEADAADVIKTVQEVGTYKPGTESGKVATDFITGILGVPATVGEWAGNKEAEAGAALGFPKLGAYGGAMTNATIQAAPMLLGARAAGELKQVPRVQSPMEARVRGSTTGFIEKHVDPHLPGGVPRAAARIVQEVAGDRAPAVEAQFQKQPANPLNIPQHAGEVATAAGSTEFAALQKRLSQHKASEYADQEAAAADARIEAIRRVGKTPAELNAAVAKRNANSRAAYDEAWKDSIVNDESMQGIVDLVPARALREARDLAKLKGETFDIGTVDQPVASYPVKSLHYIKQGLDNLINNSKQFGIGGSRRAALIDLKNQLVERMIDPEKGSPAYGKARDQYAADSKVINQMEIGQALESKLRGPLGNEQAGAFAGAAKESAGLIKKSTGEARYQDLSEVLNPEQMQIVDALVENLSNKAKFEKQAQKGEVAMSERMEKAIPYIPPTGILNPHISLARGLINRLSAASTDRVLHYLSEVTRNPTQANISAIMKKATPQEKVVLTNILRTRNQALVGASVAGAEQQAQQ